MRKVFWEPVGEDVTIVCGAKSVLIPKIDFVSEVRIKRKPLTLLNFNKIKFVKILKLPIPIINIFEAASEYYDIIVKAGDVQHCYSYKDKDEAIQDRKTLMMDIEEFWNKPTEDDFIKIWESR